MVSRRNCRYRLLLRAMLVVVFLMNMIKSGQGRKEADLGGATVDRPSSSKRSTPSLSSSGRSLPRIRAAWSGSSRTDTSFPLVHLHFCLDCSNPAAEGSVGDCIMSTPGVTLEHRCRENFVDILNYSSAPVIYTCSRLQRKISA